MKLLRLSMMEHAVAQTGLVGLQVATIASNTFPFPWNLALAGGIGIVQGFVGLWHHHAPVAPKTGPQ